MWSAVRVHARGAGKNGLAVARIAALAARTLAAGGSNANRDPIAFPNVMAIIATTHCGNGPDPFMATDGWVVGFT